ncbi:Response regulator receiver domain-containing protein [Cnuella takakiae]|uniref:Response regulator receiver domain-containing protein n=1 Tax=Cnuella takakiae TaxID=1302690 RepID=A0A1M4ZB52_9BACT|nr:response regulator [Cnuella takakiae]OLY94268.1 hypothetical protein BUE76_22060 [Cnuella takakiae]SHF15188.1 Response regulator receiver domain-containing protein [Cnuella takakiae]
MTMILIIAEDDFDQQAIYKECIAEIDPYIQIRFAVNGYDLLGTLASCEFEGCMPDMVLLDLNMPYMDGRTVLAKLKDDQRFCKLKVVIFTESEYPIDRYFGQMFKTPYYVKGKSKNECIEVFKSIINSLAQGYN